MKKKIKLLITAFSIACISISVNAQEDDCHSSVQSLKVTSKTALEEKWKSLNTDNGFKTLLNEVEKKGFVRMKETKDSNPSYGFTCISQEESKIVKAEFYAFDFVSKDGKQACSMIWRKKGNDIYKAYVVLAKGQKTFFESFEAGEEWFVDDKNEIQIAHSFRKCFKKCVLKKCPGWCIGAMAPCGVAAAALLETGPGAAIFFGICAGASCATCMAVCAIGC